MCNYLQVFLVIQHIGMFKCTMIALSKFASGSSCGAKVVMFHQLMQDFGQVVSRGTQLVGHGGSIQ